MLLSRNACAYTKRSIFCIVYVGLTSITFFFVRDSLQQFLKKETYFLTNKEHLNQSDTPTLVLCFEAQDSWGRFQYLSNLTLYVNDRNIRNVSMWANYLIEGRNEVSNLTGDKSYLMMKQMDVQDVNLQTIVSKVTGETSYILYRHCLKISPEEVQLNKIEFWMFIYPRSIGTAKLYVTSEENSYGAVFSKWYDGSVDPFTLHDNIYHQLHVSQIKETQYVQERCKKEKSYYQCLASKLEQSTNKSCTNLTMPTSTKYQDWPNCDTFEEAASQYRALVSLHSDEKICKQDGDKMCLVKEFMIQEHKQLPIVSEYYPFVFSLDMDAQASPDGGHRISKPFKNVFKETYIIDKIQMVGNIGGTLGLMIGFSFLTCLIEWIGSIALGALTSKVLKWTRARKRIEMIKGPMLLPTAKENAKERAL